MQKLRGARPPSTNAPNQREKKKLLIDKRTELIGEQQKDRKIEVQEWKMPKIVRH